MSQWWIAALAPMVGLIGLCALLWPGADAESDRAARSGGGRIRLTRRAAHIEADGRLSPPAS
ncbi:MAG TPA: hypothetical protein VD973_07645 [Symbiobacteriaceae bacterium]|nr:hypothetical protein [Symbiobacteriaceae bacterium]